MITLHQRIITLMAASFILFLIIYLIKKRHLRERYSYIWVLAGIAIIILPLKYQVIQFLTKIIGAKSEVTTLFLVFGFFVILLLIQLCINISSISNNLKNLAQKVSLLEFEIFLRDKNFYNKPATKTKLSEGNKKIPIDSST